MDNRVFAIAYLLLTPEPCINHHVAITVEQHFSQRILHVWSVLPDIVDFCMNFII